MADINYNYVRSLSVFFSQNSNKERLSDNKSLNLKVFAAKLAGQICTKMCNKASNPLC